MKVLYDCYQRLSVTVRSNAMRKHERQTAREMDRIRRWNWEPRRWEKTQEEVELGKKLWHSIDKWIKEGKAKQDAAGKKFDPTFKVESKNKEHWGEMLIERLIRERRQMPKEERLKNFRNDSIDEVDTTDLENWTVKRHKKPVYEEIQDARAPYDLIKEIDEMEVESDGEDKKMEELTHELIIRHRIDIGKMYLNHDGGYSLRKFKRIFKIEMEERPEKYMILRPGSEVVFEDRQKEVDSKSESLTDIEAAIGE